MDSVRQSLDDVYNTDLWINLKERIRMVLLDSAFANITTLTHLGTRIELLYDDFINIPFALPDIHQLLSLRKKKSHLYTRLVSILGFNWDRASHKPRYISFHVNINNEHIIDSAVWIPWCTSLHDPLQSSTDNRIVRSRNLSNETIQNAIITEANENRDQYLELQANRNERTRINTDINTDIIYNHSTDTSITINYHSNINQITTNNNYTVENDLKSVSSGKKFKLNLNEHPTFIDAMNRFVNLQYQQSLSYCKICKERWWQDNHYNADGSYTCKRCSTEKNDQHTMDYSNCMDPFHAPSNVAYEQYQLLPPLSIVEMKLIALRITVQHIFHIKKSGLTGCSGHVISLLQDLQTFINSLPRKLTDISIVKIRRTIDEVPTKISTYVQILFYNGYIF